MFIFGNMCIQRHVDERHMAFSSSVLQRGSNTFVGLRFWGVSWHQSINHTNSTRVWFIRSATPYCSGVLIGCCHLMMYPSGLEELLELCGCRNFSNFVGVGTSRTLWVCMPTLVGSQNLPFVPTFILNRAFPFLELVKDLTLLLQDIHPQVVCVVINECEEMHSSTK